MFRLMSGKYLLFALTCRDEKLKDDGEKDGVK